MKYNRIDKGNFVFKGEQPDGIELEFVFDNINPLLPTTKRITTYPILN